MKSVFQFLRDTPIVWIPPVYAITAMALLYADMRTAGGFRFWLWIWIFAPLAFGFGAGVALLFQQWKENQKERPQ